MAYPKVKIYNSTQFIVSGEVDYMSVFCSDDNYDVTPDTAWEAKSRGVCLLTKITATVKTPSGEVKASPYKSSGTSYSKFAVISLGQNKFAVTRVVSSVEGDAEDSNIPKDYKEPTEKQK